MALVLSFPEKVRTVGLSQRESSVDAARVDMQLSDLTAKLSRLKPGDTKRDLSVAIFVLTVTMSHAHHATQLISDTSLKQQFEDKLREINDLLQAASAENARL